MLLILVCVDGGIGLHDELNWFQKGVKDDMVNINYFFCSVQKNYDQTIVISMKSMSR